MLTSSTVDLPALSFRGRLSRAGFWWTSVLLLASAALLTLVTGPFLGRSAALIVSPLFFWMLTAAAVQRLRDLGRSPWWLLAVLVPVLGPLWLTFWLGFRPGLRHRASGYLAVELASPQLVNDVTGLNPVQVTSTLTPSSIEDLQRVLRTSDLPLSVGGGHFSMGGQVASPGSLHLDLRKLNAILAIDAEGRTAHVQSGVRWCDLQAALDPHDLSIKIMQTYANFTVGGALSVNCHGRYVGLGPLILSVQAIRLVLADGGLVRATPTENADLFYGAIGGYGAFGIIVEAELSLAANTRVERQSHTLATSDYAAYFAKQIRDDPSAVFHNADLYPGHFTRANAVTWRETNRPATVKRRLQPTSRFHVLSRYMLWAISETLGGRWRREHLVDPLLFRGHPVHPRNYEAGYDVAELEPRSREHTTYVLQEYFIPVERFMDFVGPMAEIFQRHRVNVINVSVRHARPDPGSLLAWARAESFAFVVYYKQRTTAEARRQVGEWTRALIDAALACNGSYYLPYQPHATDDQFHRAYPRAKELFALKRRLDPHFRFRNVLWDKYYAPTLATGPSVPNPLTPAKGDFHQVYGDPAARQRFGAFLQNVYHLFPADRFDALIATSCARHQDDQSIYTDLQAQLPSIQPFLGIFTYALPSLGKQKQEMARQVRELVGARTSFDGYVEIGTTGRYVRPIQKQVQLKGRTVLVNDVAPTNSPADIAERGGLLKLGDYQSLAGYAPLTLPDASVDLVTCFIGLHHCAPDRVEAFVRSIARVLRPGGLFILRDHDAADPAMVAFVALAHIVFNAGLGVSWAVNAQEPRHFAPVAHWTELLTKVGLKDRGPRLAQAGDPTLNLLMAFEK